MPFVLIDYWNHVTHRHDDDRAGLSDLSVLRMQGFLGCGIASYGQSQEGRVTLFAQGPAQESQATDYYYRDKYEDLVRTPVPPTNEICSLFPKVNSAEILKQHSKEESVPGVCLRNRLLSRADAESHAPARMPADSLFDGEGVTIHRLIPYSRYQTLLECFDVGRSFLEARNGLELVEGILCALYGESQGIFCSTSSHLSQATAMSSTLGTFIGTSVREALS